MFFQARMKACLWQKSSVAESNAQPAPVLSTMYNQPRPYYQPTLTFPQQMNMNFHQQTSFFNRNVRKNILMNPCH